MSDVAAPAAPAAPAAVAPEAPKTHHAQQQPRTPQGQFNGPPGAATPAAEAPPPERPRYKIGDTEYDDPNEVAAIANERHVERGALESHYRALQERETQLQTLREELERAKRGELLDDQTRDRIALERARRFQQEQEEAALPEEQRAFLRQVREMQAREAAYKSELEKIKKAKADEEAKQKQTAEQKQQAELRQQMGTTIKSAMAATGLPMTDDLVRLVSAEMRAGLMAGVEYPPEVLARRVQQRWHKSTAELFKTAKPEDLFKRIPTLVDALNALEDPAILRQLAPKLGDRLRRLNLESIGARPTLVQPPSSPTAPVTEGAIDPKTLAPGDPRWDEYFRQRAKQ